MLILPPDSLPHPTFSGISFPGNSQLALTEVPDFLSSVLIGRKKMELLNGGVTMIRSDNKKCCSKIILTIIIIVAHIIMSVFCARIHANCFIRLGEMGS